MKSSKTLHMLAFSFAMIGAINWGLIGLLKINLVNLIFGTFAGLETLVYIVVGVSAVYILATHMTDCKICSKK